MMAPAIEGIDLFNLRAAPFEVSQCSNSIRITRSVYTWLREESKPLAMIV
jgi:hypothetical protein